MRTNIVIDDALMTVLEMLGQKLAIQSAEKCRSLRARGVTVRRTVDVIIATCCIEHGLPPPL